MREELENPGSGEENWVDEEGDWIDEDGLIDGILNSPVFVMDGLRLFRHVRLCDLVPASGGLKGPGRNKGKGWCFSLLVCHGTQVVFAGLVTDIESMNCFTTRFTFQGLPTLWAEDEAEQLKEALDLLEKWHDTRPAAAWRYEPRPISREDWPILAGKGLLAWEARFEPTCTITAYGTAQGVAECVDRGGARTLCCTIPAWLDIWDREKDQPMWSGWGLDHRLDYLKRGLVPDLGYYLAAAERLMDMPMDVLLDGLSVNREILEEEMGDASAVTYLDMIREADKLRREGLDLREDHMNLFIAVCAQMFGVCYQHRKQQAVKRGRWGW